MIKQIANLLDALYNVACLTLHSRFRYRRCENCKHFIFGIKCERGIPTTGDFDYCRQWKKGSGVICVISNE